MPCAEKKPRVRFTYFVATRILRSWVWRKAVATSSMSAMLRTSIQACGTATTTLAWPKPSGSISTTLAVGIGDHLAHQVLAGDAKMHGAGGKLRRDLGSREIGDLDAVEPGDGAAIVARAARLDQRQAGAREEGFGVLLQPALGRHGQHQRRTHAPPP